MKPVRLLHLYRHVFPFMLLLGVTSIPSCVEPGKLESGNCTVDDDCAPGRICVDDGRNPAGKRTCEDPCSSDDDCGDGQVCEAIGARRDGARACLTAESHSMGGGGSGGEGEGDGAGNSSGDGDGPDALACEGMECFCNLGEYVDDGECKPCPEDTREYRAAEIFRQFNEGLGGAGGAGSPPMEGGPRWDQGDVSCSCPSNYRVLDGACEPCDEDKRAVGGEEITGANTICSDLCQVSLGISCEKFDAGGFFKSPNPGEDDEMGSAVALSETFLAIGARGDDRSGDSIPDAGVVYIFERTENLNEPWLYAGQLTPDTRIEGEFFGQQMKLSGEFLAVGAKDALYVFRVHNPGDGLQWTQEAKLVAPDVTKIPNSFPAGFAIDSNATDSERELLAVGASTYRETSEGMVTGSVLFYERNSEGSWLQLSSILTPSDGQWWEYFGVSVAMQDGTLLVGASNHDIGDKNDRTGAVYSYTWDENTETWGPETILHAQAARDDSRFGLGLSLDGNIFVSASPLDDSSDAGVIAKARFTERPDATLTDSGAVFVFERSPNDGTWEETSAIKAKYPWEGDEFGKSASLQGNRLVVCAPHEDGDATSAGSEGNNDAAPESGACYLFERGDDGVWSQTNYLKTAHSYPWTLFGESVALDGEEVLIGALLDDSNRVGYYPVEPQRVGFAPDSGAAFLRPLPLNP